MTTTMRKEQRKHPRFETNLPARFNLNPDYHYVPTMSARYFLKNWMTILLFDSKCWSQTIGKEHSISRER